jgi:AraC-like DNA-binding protein
MEVKTSIIYFLTATGIINTLFLSLFLFRKKSRNPIANKLLSLILLLFTIKIGYATLDMQLIPWAFFYTLYTKIAVIGYLCLVPVFLFYINAVTNKEYRPGRKEALYFIPAFLYGINPFESFFWSNHGFYSLQMVYCGFTIISVVKLYRLWKSYRQSKIPSNKKIFTWLVLFQLGMIFIWWTAIGAFIYELTAFYSLAFYALVQIVIGDFKNISAGWQHRIADLEPKTDLIIRLNTLMSTEKVFLDSSLTLPLLAQRLKVTLHVLSHEINTFYNQNFTEYINSFRITEACKMLSSDLFDNLTIEGIAYDCGFNSLSSFNAAFKKMMNCTPSQYRMEKKNSLSISYN